jgi:TorA maturation chaperone TorD
MLSELRIDIEPAAAISARPALPPEEVRAECEQRAAVYRLLAGVFVEEPGVEFLASLRAPDSLAALAQAGLKFDDDFLRPDLEALADALACEYTTMFAASGGFPPIESVRLTGRYQQAPHFDVKETYRRAGFAVRAGRFKVIEDHLGIELMFVAELLDRSIDALNRGDFAGYRALERDIKRFWTLHLGRWVRGYCRLVERASEHSLYREMARLLAGFADEEIASMRLRIDDLDRGREVVPKSEVQIAFNPDEPVCNACGPAAAALPPGSIPIELRTGADAARPD